MKKLFITLLIVCSLIIPGNIHADGTVNQLRGVWVQDIGGSPLIGLNQPKWVDNIVLVANVAKTYTVPTGAKSLLFSATTNFYVSYGGTAAVPSVDVTNGTGVELNPVLRSLDSSTTAISIISPVACIVAIIAYK